MPQLATVLKAGWRVFCCGPAAYASQVHVKFSHLHREIRNFEYEYALHRIPLVGNKSWRENGRKRAQYVAIRERLSALRNDSSMLSPPFLILSLLGLTEMTLVNNVSSFIIDVCNTRHCCAAVASRRAPSTFVYRRKTEKLILTRVVFLFWQKREKARWVWVCVLLLFCCAPWPERQMTFGHSLRLSKLIETWTGADREVMLIWEDSEFLFVVGSLQLHSARTFINII